MVNEILLWAALILVVLVFLAAANDAFQRRRQGKKNWWRVWSESDLPAGRGVPRSRVGSFDAVAEPDFELLCKWARSDDVRKRDQAAIQLASRSNPRVCDVLCSLLKDRVDFVRESAAFGLCQLGDGRAIVPLSDFLATDQGAGILESVARRVQGSSFGEQLLEETLQKRVTPMLDTDPSDMTRGEMLVVLLALCLGYAGSYRRLVAKLEPVATQIGEELHRTGGIEAMREVFAQLGSGQGVRTLEMHWNGIGEWRG